MANQDNTPLPGGKNYKRSAAEFLPAYFRTNTNKKFLQATIDQFLSDGVVEKLNGFVGKKEAKAVSIDDSYISEINSDRENYQFEPHAVYKDDLDNVEFAADYLDYLGLVKTYRGNTANHSNLNEQEFYAWNPHIDFDKFTNFREYYWLPNGPEEVPVRGQSRDVISTYNVTTVTDDDNTALLFTPDGRTRNPNLKLYRGQTYRFEINTDGFPVAISLDRKFVPVLGNKDTVVGVSDKNNVIGKIFDQSLTAWIEGIDWNALKITDNDLLTGKNSVDYNEFENPTSVQTRVESALTQFKTNWNELLDPYVDSLDFLAYGNKQLSTTSGNDTIIDDTQRYDRAEYVCDSIFRSSNIKIKNTIFVEILNEALGENYDNNLDTKQKILDLAYTAAQIVLDEINVDTTVKLYNFTQRNVNPFTSDQDTDNVSFIYTEGVTYFPEPIEGDTNEVEDFVSAGYIENGVLEFTIPDNAPNELYFVSQNNIDTSCRLKIYDIEENTEIDVENEIIGKKSYTTSDGWSLSNGMKIYFQGFVTPEKYNNGLYYVEGVGSSIHLIPLNELSVPAIFTQDTQVPFDTNGFDRVPFSNALSFAGTKDYIVISRNSPDKNGWSRYNRWFHKDVILKSSEINGQDQYNFDENARAKRPIIEFESGLRLLNHGTKNKNIVDLVDDFTQDVFSTIEGKIAYNVDGVDLAEDMRILFTADPDPFVNGKIYIVKFIDHNNAKNRISLIEADDTTPLLDETVLVKNGSQYAGRMFWYNGTEWNLAQDKNSINQFPKFDLFDSQGNSYSDIDTYPLNNFKGNEIFSYQVGEGANDDELGFPLIYKNLVNSGDILFEFDLLKQTYNYEISGVVNTLNSDVAYVKKYNLDGEDFVFENAWKKANTKSKQYVIRKYTGQEQTNSFPVDFFDNSASIKDLKLIVYKNNKLLQNNVDYEQININNTRYVVFENDIEFDDIVVIKGHSSTTKNENGYYETPHNFERNPQNNNIIEFTYGQVNDHVEGLITEIPGFEGLQPGLNNLRDLGSVYQYGRKFVQHSGPINLPLVNLGISESNIVNALRFAKREYNKFKRDFVQIAETLGVDAPVKQHVDLILAEYKKNKRDGMPFFNSDMLGSGGSKRLEYTVLDDDVKYYALSQPFNLDIDNRSAVYVYINGQQICYGTDYTFTSEGFVYITKSIAVDDLIEIEEYETTEGSFIAPTPTKLGMYPAYKPEKFVDTTYNEISNVIRGHDGSITIAYDDYRDDLILELERRIYNNIKVSYNTDIFDIHDYVGGEYRNTGISKNDIDTVLITDFVEWVRLAGNVDYTDNSFIQQFETLTYNYKKSISSKNTQLPGFWRQVYIQAYDTDSPNLRPWEMLGFSVQPMWWEEVYGPAPYTKDNLILWKDLEEGIVREPGKQVARKKKYIRPGLTKNIPVTESGHLASPLDSGYAKEFSFATSREEQFSFGDGAPAESAWRRSSEYPFALITSILLNRPAAVTGLLYDRSRIQRDNVGNLVYKDTLKRINTKDLVYPATEENGVRNYTAGLVNYIESYMRNNITTNYNSYMTTVSNLNNQLGFKLGGFAEKSKLRLVLDSRTPTNKGNVFVPYENYNITLKKSSPLDTVSYSGVIIEKVSRGYKVSGYDLEDPFFNTIASNISANDPTITIGGISESFIEWNEGKIFDRGRIVQYQNVYYRTNETHTSTDSFDTTKFSKLAELPIVGGATAIIRKNFSNKIQKVNYGTVFNTIQEVADFLLGYNEYLKRIGFSFSYWNPGTEAVESFDLLLREFLFFTTENWAGGTVLTISPAANQIDFSRDFFTVDNVYDNYLGYNIKQIDGNILKVEFTNTARNDGNNFSLFPVQTTEGIYFSKFSLVQKEHVVLIDNKTVFNDTIFDPEPGYRQERIKVVGYRTDEWNGSLNIPGFIYDQSKFTLWEPWQKYNIADIVKYKEFYYSAKGVVTGSAEFDPNEWTRLDERPTESIKPNFDYRAKQFNDFYDLDTDNFDSEQQRLAQHLIGYQKRNYLSNIITDDVSQYKFYQGFIQDKGTLNSLTKLFDKLGSANKDSLEFNEEWAFRTAQYGATDAYKEVEYQLDESKFRLEPQLVELVNAVDNRRTDLVFQYPLKDVYVKEPDYNHKPFPVKWTTDQFTKTGGFVSLDQIDFISKTLEDILNLDITQTQIGSVIWVPEYKNTWDIFETTNPGYYVNQVEKTESGFIAIFDRNVPFAVGDIIGLNNVSEDVDGFRLVRNVTKNRVEFFTTTPIGQDFIDVSDSTLGNVIQLLSKRVANIDEMNTVIETYGLTTNSKFWVDNVDNTKYAVYQNNEIFVDSQNLINNEDGKTYYGSAIATNGNNTSLVISDIDNKVYQYRRLSSVQSYSLAQEITPYTNLYDSISNFGQSLEITNDGSWLIVGAPTASNVKTRYKGEIQETSYLEGDVVSDGGLLFEAVKDINFDSSTLNTQSEDWQQVNAIEANEDGNVSGLNDQGVVHIFKKQTDGAFALYQTLLSPMPEADEKFGIAVKSSFDPTTLSTRVYVRSEKNNGRIYFIDLPNIDSTFGYSRDPKYRGKFDSNVKYISGEIVEHNALIYTAVKNVPAGDEFDPTDWDNTTSDIDRQGYVPITADENIIDIGDSTIFDNNIRIAENFAVDQKGNVLILTGYNTAQTEYQIVVYRKTEGSRFVRHQIISPELQNIEFGHSVDVSDNGDYIAVGAIFANDQGIDTGKVYIYAYNTDTQQFEIQQELITPSPAKNERFGWQVEFSLNKLAVTGINGENQIVSTFDSSQTIFDSQATEFKDVVKNQYEIYIYEIVDGKYVYAENVDYSYYYNNQDGVRTRALLNDAIQPTISFNKNHVMLSLPNVSLDDTGTKNGIVFDLIGLQDTNSWDTLSSAKSFVDYEKLKGVFLYDKTNGDLITYLDVIDPIRGKIANTAEQELTYKLYYDPAVFNTGSSDTGTKNPWTNNYVGELWWDLSTVKWYDPYQGNILSQNNKWNNVIPSFEVDVYEWVESDYLPSEWDNLSDTSAGISEGISGLSKYGDTRYSVAQTYDPITGRFTQKYYFWVRNKKTIPNKSFRSNSCETVINLIKDPSANGYRFITMFNEKEFAIHNCRSLIRGKDTIIHFDYTSKELNLRNVHSEYTLLTEGESTSEPNDILVEKWIDSLVGYDEKSNKLPDLNVSPSRRYGILNEPLQTMFVNKSEALKQIVERVNSVLSENLIVDDFDLSPLDTVDPLPSDVEGLYDEKVDNEGLLRFVGTAKTEQAQLQLQIVDGRIVDVDIINPGRGYKDPAFNSDVDNVRRGPAVEIVGNGNGAEISTEINNLGQVIKATVIKSGNGYTDDTVVIVRKFSVLVTNDSNIGGFWALYNWNKQQQEWFRKDIQDYDTTFYWQYKDWYATGYDLATPIDHLIPASYALDGLNDNIGDIVKIENIGTGGWLLLRKVDNIREVDYTVNYQTIGRQNGTIQFSKLLYNNIDSGFDNQIYDSVLYDREPVNETRIILKALRDNIFVDQLKVEWNKLFFSSIRYVLAEQPTVDWVFKSSFIRAKHNVGELDQRITFRNDNLENYQDYVAEAKPYSTKIREYISSYEKIDPTQTSVTDFDLQPRYSEAQKRIIAESVKIDNNVVGPLNRFIQTYPQKHWLDNLGYEITDIVIADGGSGWESGPVVTISEGGGPTLTGKAIIARGVIVNIDVDTQGALYTSLPTIEFEGSQTEEGTSAKAVAILGNSKVRSTHMSIKFDRTYGSDIDSTLYDNIDKTETFTANAGIETYNLEWPMDLAVANIEVTVNGIESLSSEYTSSNNIDNTVGYTRYKGAITFTTAPATGSTIVVNYKINASMLHAADRIRYHYNPTTGMLGRDLSQLMDGIDFSGVQVDSISLTGNQGFETVPFGVGEFDTYDTSFDDFKYIADGSTQVIDLQEPLEAGVLYTVYKNNIRLDDENYDENQTPDNQIGVANPNAVIRTITGDGIQNTIDLSGYNPPIETIDGDIIYVRKIDSDGSFTPGNAAFDTQLTGGDLATLNQNFISALGKDAGEIIVDGDGFISLANRGPEELVPGTVLDTLDIQVYNAVESGQGLITINNYITDGVTTSWEIDEYPQANSSVVVKLNNLILDSNSYEVDYKNKLVTLTDSTQIAANQTLSILTIGNNGNNILDSDTFTGDNETTEFKTAITYQTPISAFVTVNGVVSENYNLVKSDDNLITIDFGGAPAADSIIHYTVYAGDTQQYSQIIVDKTFDNKDYNTTHSFDEIGFPFNDKPIADKILVKKGDKFLKSHYSIEYDITTARQYDIQEWAIDDIDSVRKEDVVVYVNGEVLSRNFWTYDSTNFRVILLQYNKGVPGDRLQIYVIKNSEYTFITTEITLASADDLNGPAYEFDDKAFINFEFADSVNVNGRVLSKRIGHGNKETIIQLQGYVRDFINHYPELDSVAIDDISNADPAVVTSLTPHNMSTGDKVYIQNVEGMTELNEKNYYVQVVSTTQLRLYTDENTTNSVNSIEYTPYERAGVISTLVENDVLVTSYVNKQQVDINGFIQKIEFLNTEVLTLTEPTNDDIEIYVFSNHDVNDFSRISYDMVYNSTSLPSDSQDYIDRNLLSRGYIRLNKPAIAPQYVWVILNGTLLTAGKDYALSNNKNAIQLNQQLTDNDRVEILQFGSNVSEPKFAFRQFKDVLNRTHYKRISEQQSYKLAKDLNYYDQFIQLEDATDIDQPNETSNIPGVLWVNGERIEYLVKEGNFLRRLRRGTLGTSINNYLANGTKVYNQGLGLTIPYADEIKKTSFVGQEGVDSFVLDFDLWNHALAYYTKFESVYKDPSKTLDQILAEIATNFIDVFVAGRRLRKTSLSVFDQTLAQDSPAGDILLPPEFVITSDNVITFATAPANLQKIEIIRKYGKVWNDPNTPLGQSENNIAKFLSGATIKLTR